MLMANLGQDFTTLQSSSRNVEYFVLLRQKVHHHDCKCQSQNFASDWTNILKRPRHE